MKKTTLLFASETTVLNAFIGACSKSIISDAGFKDGFISNKYLRKRVYAN